jgi:endoglycosylceramidase
MTDAPAVRLPRASRGLVLGLALVLLGLAQAGCDQPHQAFLRDDQGRALVLHGLNVASGAKGPTWHDGPPADPGDGHPWITEAEAHRIAQDWGFNVVRYLIFWEHVEPQPGVYDDAYLDQVAERVGWFRDAGVWVILDMHQDVYGKLDTSGRAIGFNGAPQWATITDGEIFNYNRMNWSLNYLNPAVLRAFDHLWNYDDGTHPELQDRYAAMWRHVAGRFAGTSNVLGYDLMNEPWAGSSYGFDWLGQFPIGDPAAQALWEATKLADFYRRVTAEIRSVDEDSWIFIEPAAAGSNEGSPSHLPKLDDPRGGDPQIAYFPHYYSLVMGILGSYDPALDTSIPDWEANRRSEIRHMGTPLLIGEFGAGPEFGNYLQNLEETVEMADRVTSGWTYWSHDPGSSWSILDGAHQEVAERADVLVRAYPQRVAGTIGAYSYDPQQRSFDLTWTDEPGVTGATEIYVPARRFYPEGFEVTLFEPLDSGWVSWDATREVLAVRTVPGISDHALRIVPQPPPGGPPPPGEGSVSRQSFATD